uniref:RRM domain-containing protein n=1 Tax=Cairina moschata TaxID=8855 RepID=A0A8C3GIE4_CAIMO
MSPSACHGQPWWCHVPKPETPIPHPTSSALCPVPPPPEIPIPRPQTHTPLPPCCSTPSARTPAVRPPSPRPAPRPLPPQSLPVPPGPSPVPPRPPAPCPPPSGRSQRRCRGRVPERPQHHERRPRRAGGRPRRARPARGGGAGDRDRAGHRVGRSVPSGADEDGSAALAAAVLRQVRTLFVSGLPLDIKPRELYLLFRPFKGYEGSLIKLTSKQPVGFVSFDSRSEAEAAKNALNGSFRGGEGGAWDAWPLRHPLRPRDPPDAAAGVRQGQHQDGQEQAGGHPQPQHAPPQRRTSVHRQRALCAGSLPPRLVLRAGSPVSSAECHVSATSLLLGRPQPVPARPREPNPLGWPQKKRGANARVPGPHPRRALPQVSGV